MICQLSQQWKVLEHIQKLTRCSTEHTILITMDNHESHCTLDAIQYCRANGMILVTFPPHCTHRMQPLDVAVNGPFKQKLAVAQNDWLLNHPGRTITIHDLAGIVTPAYNASYTARNILSGFSKPGIVPFSRNAFSDEDFECAEVTNRPMQDTLLTKPGLHNSPTEMAAVETPPRTTVCEDMAIDTANILPALFAAAAETPLDNLYVPDAVAVHEFSAESVSPVMSESAIAESSSDVPISATSRLENILTTHNATTAATLLSPEVVRPFPKAPPRKETNRGRKKGKSRILTDTPEKNEIEKAFLERQERLHKIVKKQTRKRSGPAMATKNKRKPKTKSKLEFSDSETDLEEVNLWMPNEEDSDLTDCGDDTDMESEATSGPIKTGDFVLAQVPSEGSKRTLAYVGKIENEYDRAFNVSFLKKKPGFNKFFFPEKEDRAYISILDILTKLPPPIEAGSTSRTAAMFSFKSDFSLFKLGQ